MIAREALRWNGWGPREGGAGLAGARAEAILAELGRRLDRRLWPAAEPVALEDVPLPAPRVPESVLARLRAACGEEGVRTSPLERVSHAMGKSLPDLLRLRRGEVPSPPDAVVAPADEGAVASVLRIAADAELAVIPFGGGTSVVGGVEPAPGDRHRGAISLDTTRLDRLLRLDGVSHTATFQAGIDGPALERALAARGFTLGHQPQSFEQSTLGGWIATRSTGQLSQGYGPIERLVVALRVVTPEGVIRTLEVPRSAAGPDLGGLLLGSEGLLGVIVEATVRVRPAPEAHDDRGLLFPSFGAGVAAVRELVREGPPLALLRLSDAAETETQLAFRRDPARRLDGAGLVLRAAAAFGWGEGRCAAVYGAEGPDRRTAARRASSARRRARAHGALPLGRAPGRSWRRERYRGPFLRDWLLDHDVAVETLETALPWSRLEDAHRGVLGALEASLETHAGGGLAMAHLSHAYPDGASLYFTLVYPLDPTHGVKQWGAIKRDATNAVLERGGTLSHHHGVGSDHAPWLREEKGALGVETLRAAKGAVDPKGLLNPGKWL